MGGAATAAAARAWGWLPRGGSLPEETWRRRHRGITIFALLHLPVLSIVIAAGGHSGILVEVGMIAVAALAACASVGSQQFRASMATSSLLVSCGLLIHLFGGLIEIHFHFFVVLAVVAMYQAWTPYLVGLGFVVGHHLLMGILMPAMVYNHPLAIAHPVVFTLVHAGFVLAESVALLTNWKVAEEALDAEREARVAAERSRAELGEANEQIADLVAMMSHDLRTPVAVVTGYGDLTLDSWDDLDEVSRRAFVGKMTKAGRALDQMLTETLTLAAMDTHGLISAPTAVPLGRLLADVVDTTLPDRADEIEAEVGDLRAYADAGQLKQILANLLSNAVKYGTTPITVSAAEVGGTVEIRVCDSGGGVPEDFVPQLFDRWSRAEEVRGGAVRGTGLGLHIVRQLAIGNGGDVAYEPTAHGGACFAVTLPAPPAGAALIELPEPRQAEVVEEMAGDASSRAPG